MKFLVLALSVFITLSVCSPKCSRNEQFRECGTACEPSCDDPMPACTRQCINNVCQCANGFLRNTATKKCVPKAQCPDTETTVSPQCKANETFTECGTACEPSCSSPEPLFCTMQCILNVCQCSPGFVRGTSGCIKRKDC